MTSNTFHRDPFARGAYRRFCLPNADEDPGSCAWCGQTPHRLFSYVWEPDDKPVRTRPDSVWFCNFGCFSDYNA
jgi:hypothetical protein